MYIAETQMDNTLPIPPGVSYSLTAGQMVKIEAHYINTTADPIQGMGTIELTAVTGGQFQTAGIMFCGSVLQLYYPGVVPGMSTLNPGFYQPPAGTSMFGLTTHQHARGTLMTVAKSTGASDTGQLLTNGTPYNNEPFVIYTAPNLLTFAPNEGLRWQCFYDNTTSQTFKFGQSAANNEMCFLWGYYYPAANHFISEYDCWQ
jgi:hypothetical protein